MWVSARSVHCGLLLSALLGGLGSGCSGNEAQPRLGQTRDPLSQALGSELEPNGSALSATPLGNDSVVRANLFPAADLDYFSFAAQAGDRVFASTLALAGSDTVLSVLAPDGTTELELDDDGGWGYGSSIAGLVLPQAGTYFVKVEAFDGTIRPYDLHVRLQSGTPVAELEPNDTLPTAQPLPASGWISGSTSAADDIDYFSIELNAGDTVFASLDVNPQRGPSNWSGTLAIGPFSEQFLDYPSSDTDAADSRPMFLTVKTAGTYFLKVSGNDDFGAYQLSVSVHPASAATRTCQTYSSLDVPLTVPANPSQVSATITVPGHPRIADLDVSIGLSHAFPADLDIHLRSPAGNDNVLVSDRGQSAYPNWNLTFDDEAAFDVDTFSVLTGYAVMPKYLSRLGWFDGEDAGGTWRLVLEDDSTGNGGTLSDFSLTICEPSPVSCPSGSALAPLFSADFETGDDGFTHGGTADEWERGTPIYQPVTGCNSGTRCWKTDLDGSYDNRSSQELKSAPIDLTTTSAPVVLSWAMKYQLETANADHAFVQIQEVGGLNPRRLWQHLGPTMLDSIGNPRFSLQQSAGWGVQTADVSAYAGKSVELVFHLDSDASGQYAGLAIDDVSVSACTHCGNGTVEPGEQCDDHNSLSGDCCSATCRFEAASSACADANLCNGAETCDGAGVCRAGLPVSCSSSDACHAPGLCAPGTGVCSNPPVADGTACPGGVCLAGSCSAIGAGGHGGSGGTAGDAATGGSNEVGGAPGMGGELNGGATSVGATTGGGPSAGATSGEASTGGASTGGASIGGAANGGTAATAGASGPAEAGGTSQETGGAAPAEEGGAANAGDTSTAGNTMADAGEIGVAGTSSKPSSSKDEGCGCSVPGQEQPHGLAGRVAAMLGLFAAWRRRRRA